MSEIKVVPEMRTCKVCGIEKPLTEFGLNRKVTPQRYCKVCDAVDARERWWAKRDIYLKNKAEYYARNKAKLREAARQRTSTPHYKCRRILRSALRNGSVQKPSCCSRCKQATASGDLHGHHEDYGKPLEVIWLCQKCHGLVHRRVGVAKVESRKEQNG